MKRIALITACVAIAVSAGARGLQVVLNPADYVAITQAKIAPIAV